MPHRAPTVEIPERRERLHPITLAFENPETERGFRDAYAERTVKHARIGTGIAIVLWAIAIPIGTALRPEAGPSIAKLILLAMMPFQIGLFFFSFPRRLWPWMQHASAIVNVSAGVGEVLLLEWVGALDRYGFAVMMLQVVFASIALRIRFALALVATVAQVAFYLTVDRMDGTPPQFAAANLFLLLGVQAASMFGAYSLERSERRLYQQSQLIEAQKRGLEREKDKSEKLLLNVLPAAIATQLKEHTGAIAEKFPDATILFSDIVGFTPLASQLDPAALVALLDEIFSRFDDLAERHGLEKIKTIGDAYMVVGGLPTRRPDHALAVARMGLDMLGVVDEVGRRAGHALGIRIGIHTGPVVAGVIGKKKFTYDLWGDSVNIASRMESHGQPGRVHVSESTALAIGEALGLEPRGTITVKGKGEMKTFFLVGPAEKRVDSVG